MKTDVEWRKEYESRFGKVRDESGADICREFDEFVRRVQRDARASALREARDACVYEQQTFDLVARDAPRSDEGRYAGNSALVAANGIAKCVTRLSALISAAAISFGEVPLGDNPAKEKP